MVIEVSEPSGFVENENNRCLGTSPIFQPLECKSSSPTYIECGAYADYLTSLIAATPLPCFDTFFYHPHSNSILQTSLYIFSSISTQLPRILHSRSSPNPALIN